MGDYIIEFVDNLHKDIEEKVHQGHVSHEASQGIICNYKKFFIVIKNNTDEAIGVLTAYTAFSEVYVDDIWVDVNYRKQGFGLKLMKALETHFTGKGYNNINLVTSQFSAPGFYKKCGFEVEFVRTNKHNPKLTKTFFIKYFDEKIQTQGILN